MMEIFSDAKEIQHNKFADSPLGKSCKNIDLNKSPILENKSLAIICDIYSHCPIENGDWTGKRGNSKWIPNEVYIPKKSNPEEKSWRDILKDYDIDGIEYKDGEPDFSSISKGDVEIEDFSDNRDDNFDKADIELAKQRGCSPKEVKEWRKENKYTWHECKDMKTIQKVPSIVHNNMSHSGGISEVKKGV